MLKGSVIRDVNAPTKSDNIVVPSVIIFINSTPAPMAAAIGMLIPAVSGAKSSPIDTPQAADPAMPIALSPPDPFSIPNIPLNILPVPAPPVRAPSKAPSVLVLPSVSASIAPVSAPKARVKGPIAFDNTLPIFEPAESKVRPMPALVPPVAAALAAAVFLAASPMYPDMPVRFAVTGATLFARPISPPSPLNSPFGMY